MSDSQIQGLHGVRCVGDRTDGISNLPDCILHHILSFLPTKDAVKTSILSARWKNLWTSVSNIDFDDALLYDMVDGRYPPEVSCFMNFVERVLLLRDASDIKKFRLSCRVCFDASRIYSWISAAIMHNVQELDLCIFPEDPFVLPRSMFDSISLTSLKIEINSVLALPACVRFPCLKMLHLSLVTFPDDDSTQKLFSACPVLEELVMLDCEWMNLKNITISSSTLRSLTIDDLPYFGPPDNPSGCKIKIDAANLIYLKYIGYLSNEIVLSEVSSLIKAYIDIRTPSERQKEAACRVVELLKGIPNCMSLMISNLTIESLSCAVNVLDHLPVFQNLNRLELSMEIGNRTVGALMELLHRCPKLQSLCFTEGFEHCMHLFERGLILSSIPKCLLSCLKTVTFKNFHGNHSEICFLKCLLKNALVLESVNICCKKQLGDPMTQRQARRELEIVARSSKVSVVTFSSIPKE